jgi:hypothetical protein
MKRWGVAQTMYTHVSKCKNDKIRGRKEKETFLNLGKNFKKLPISTNNAGMMT